MGEMHEALMREVEKTPDRLLISAIKRKLDKAGVPASPGLAEALLQHHLSGAEGLLRWNEKGTSADDTLRNVTIVIDEEDLASLTDSLSEFHRHELPSLIDNVAEDIAKDLVRDLKANWPDHKEYEEAVTHLFEAHLDLRWSEALDLLRMLLTIARELGEDTAKRFRRSRARSTQARREAQLRLHSRACQVTAEIITLMEHGFADGAQARWRTLYEIEVVVLLITDANPELAERYLAHDIVESKRSMDTYEKCIEGCGWKPIPVREKRRVAREYDAALQRYGTEFKGGYGWAAKHLRELDPAPRGKRITFEDLERASGRASMRALYKAASFNVHAGAKALSYRLGFLDGAIAGLAGASNAGLADPGTLTADSLARATSLLFPQRMTLDDIVQSRALLLLRDQAVKAFERASNRLDRDHARVTKARRRTAKKPKRRSNGRTTS